MARKNIGIRRRPEFEGRLAGRSGSKGKGRGRGLRRSIWVINQSFRTVSAKFLGRTLCFRPRGISAIADVERCKIIILLSRRRCAEQIAVAEEAIRTTSAGAVPRITRKQLGWRVGCCVALQREMIIARRRKSDLQITKEEEKR